MLFLLDVSIDYARMGDRVAQLRAAEHDRVRQLMADRVVLLEWLKADRSGVFALWQAESEDELRAMVASVPMAPYLQKLEVHALLEHPLFPGGMAAA